MTSRPVFFAAALCALILASSACAQPAPDDLTGLWYAKLRFGPDVHGRLVVDRANGTWRASIAGRTASARLKGDSLSFELPGNAGAFTGVLRRLAKTHAAADTEIAGHWWFPNRLVTPLALASCGPSCFQGQVVPPEDALTFYLKVTRLPDGTHSAFLRNPERNIGGIWLRARSIRTLGDTVALLGRDGNVLASGSFRGGVMRIPIRGATCDFERLPDTAYTDYYPRGRATAEYYHTPAREE